jgi:hypothetical protein
VESMYKEYTHQKHMKGRSSPGFCRQVAKK